MNNIDFSNIELSFTEKATMRLLLILKSDRFFNSCTLDHLFRIGLVDRNHGRYSVNRFGKMYFRIKRKERMRFIIPTAISVVALFAGYDVYKFPLLGEALSTAKLLLVHILECLGIFS